MNNLNLNKSTKPSCKECRYAGKKLFLKGSRCYTPKCAIDKNRPSTQKKHIKMGSLFLQQSKEKRALKSIYNINDITLKKYVTVLIKKRLNAENLYIFLESRFDSVIYNCGFASSRKESQKMILHNKFKLNNKYVNKKSITIKIGDIISWEHEFVSKNILPNFCSLNQDNKSITINSKPTYNNLLINMFNANLVVELISKNL